jgi:hypothetical protein
MLKGNSNINQNIIQIISKNTNKISKSTYNKSKLNNNNILSKNLNRLTTNNFLNVNVNGINLNLNIKYNFSAVVSFKKLK